MKTEVNSPSPATSIQIRRLLVPVDFSDCSLKALDYATAFARQSGASITLLYVVQVYYAGGEFASIDMESVQSSLREVAVRELAKITSSPAFTGLTLQTLIRTGPAASEIVTTAREQNTDLIIISTHGHSGLKHILLGSVAENVVRHAPCPVLTVREREHDFVSPSTR
ncbi:MAG TPA: universal stress protein [Roseimicrobium sp.]|nr:universal stress protein [Roseimicrobium sp.]